MSYYDNEYDYYEPTVGDEIFEEAKDKLFNALKDEIKTEINYLKKENKRLNSCIDEYRKKESDLHIREIQLIQREKQTEKDIYRKKFSQVLKPLEENLTVYRIECYRETGAKCDKCDE